MNDFSNVNAIECVAFYHNINTFFIIILFQILMNHN